MKLVGLVGWRGMVGSVLMKRMQDTVQLPPTKFLTPRVIASLMTFRLTGSSTMTASSFMRRVEAASIQ